MKNIFVFLLLGLILFPTVHKVYVTGGYYLNQEYIATFLCEKKTDELSNCNGKCYLKKKAAVFNETSSTTPENVSNLFFCDFFFFFENTLKFIFFRSSLEHERLYFRYFLIDRTFDVELPPPNFS